MTHKQAQRNIANYERSSECNESVIRRITPSLSTGAKGLLFPIPMAASHLHYHYKSDAIDKNVVIGSEKS